MREKTRQRILKTMPSNAIHCDATYIRLVATKMQLLNMNAAAARIETVIKEINLHWHGDLDSRGSAIYSDCAIYLSPMYVSRGILAHELCHLLDPDEFLWGHPEYGTKKSWEHPYYDNPRERRAQRIEKFF